MQASLYTNMLRIVEKNWLVFSRYPLYPQIAMDTRILFLKDTSSCTEWQNSIDCFLSAIASDDFKEGHYFQKPLQSNFVLSTEGNLVFPLIFSLWESNCVRLLQTATKIMKREKLSEVTRHRKIIGCVPYLVSTIAYLAKILSELTKLYVTTYNLSTFIIITSVKAAEKEELCHVFDATL